MKPKRLKRPRDPIELGKLVGDILTSQVEDRESPTPVDQNKNQSAVELGRKGGLKGGKARWAKLTPEERSEAASLAAQARWRKSKT